MSVASFLARFAAKPAVVVSVKNYGALEEGSRVTLDEFSGTVDYIDGDRVVWTDEDGDAHMTLPKYLRRT